MTNREKDPEGIALARRAVDIKLYIATAKLRKAQEAIEKHEEARKALGAKAPASWYDQRSAMYVDEWRAKTEVDAALEHWYAFMAQHATDLVPVAR